MSFRSLRNSRDKKQAKSFVTAPIPSTTASGHPPSDLLPPHPENPRFRHDLPASMEMRVVPGKGRAIFSTVSGKPGFAPVLCAFRYLQLTPDSRQYTALPQTSCAGVVDPKHIEILFLLLCGARDQTLFRMPGRLVL